MKLNADAAYHNTLGVIDNYGFKMGNKYNQIYFSSNESLNDMFFHFDFEGLDVLSVLASGDQAFHFFNSGAKSVDLFDANILTLYYYYLRVWTIKYLNQYYPDVSLSKEYFDKIFSMVKPCSEIEKKVLDYWKLFVSDYCPKNISRLFLMRKFNKNNYIENLDIINSNLDRINFYNINLCDKNSIKKKYDVIFTSNIHEYVQAGTLRFNNYKMNLFNALNSGGMVIGTNIRDNLFNLIRDNMEDLFNFKEIPNQSGKTPLGFSYIKR